MKRQILALAAATALLAGCAGSKKTATVTNTTRPPAALVAKAVSQKGTLTEYVTVSGHLEPLEQADVSSKLTGVVERVSVREGDEVYPGMPLIYLDARDLNAHVDQAAAQVNAAVARERRAAASTPLTGAEVDVGIMRARQGEVQAAQARMQALHELEDARTNVARQRQLFSEDAVPKTTVEAAELRLKNAERAYQSAQAQERSAEEGVRLARANTGRKEVSQADVAAATADVSAASASLQVAAVQADYSVLKSPIRGVVVERKVEPGRTVSPASGALLRIVDNRQLELVAQIPERYLEILNPGLTALINDKVEARLRPVIPAADPEAHNLKIRLRLPNPQGLVSGMFVQAKLKVRDYTGTVVPRTAVLTTREGSYVLEVQGNKVKKTPVTLAYQTETKAVLRSGLEPATEIVTAGGEGLKDGAEIRLAQ